MKRRRQRRFIQMRTRCRRTESGIFNLILNRILTWICCAPTIMWPFVCGKRALLDRAGLLRPEYEGAQDYDLVLRCAEKAGGLLHVPRILYHWRTHDNSTSENPQSKLYAFDAGQRAVQAHFDRLGIKAEVCPGEYLGIYRTAISGIMTR